MRNHFHLVIETPNANLVEGMRWLLSSYTIRLNHRHRLFGHVFSGIKREMLRRMDGQLGENHSGELRQESAGARAGRILAEELKRLGWKATELARRRKSDPDKLAIAARLRRETTLSIKSIAGRVQLGSSKSANANLHSWMKAHPEAPVTPVRTEPETRKAKTRPKGAAHDSRKTGPKQKSTGQKNMKTIKEQRHGPSIINA